MNTLIIPCLGKKRIDGIPQYIMKHPCGKMNLLRCVEGIWSNYYDMLLIVLSKDDEQEFSVEKIIRKEFVSYPIKILILDQDTNGPAETVYQAIKKEKLVGPIVIKDNDSYIKADEPKGNFVVGLDLNLWEKDVSNLRNKSFLLVNEQKNILDIFEKRISSPIISMGLYGFKNAENYIAAYEKLNNSNYTFTGLYISHVISYLIGYWGKVFQFVNLTEYEGWGTDKLWRELKEEYEASNRRS